jgi:hypothetical protein
MAKVSMPLHKFLMLAGLVVAGVAVSASASAGVCFDLWVARNSIHKAYGYRFKTSKAINYFGNASTTTRLRFPYRVPTSGACWPSKSARSNSAASKPPGLMALAKT